MENQNDQKTIMLVEDEALIAMSEEMTLKKYGYEVIIISSGEEAVKAGIEDQNIDLILMDIDLGNGIDGTEAASRILEKRDLPLIFLSSHSEPEIVEKTESISSYGYIEKNSSMTVLNASIKMAFKLYDANKQLKNKEKKLKENEENLKITLQSIGDAVIAVDLKGKVRRMNPVAENLTGWKTEEAVGRDLIEVFVIKNALTEETAENPVERVLESGTIVGLANHTKLISKDGQEYQIADSASPIRNDQDELNGVVLIFRDVTEEYRIQREMEQTNALLEAVVQQSPVPMVLVTADDLVIRMINQTCLEFLGIPDQDLTGQRLDEMDKSWTDYDIEGRLVPLDQSPIVKALNGELTEKKAIKLIDRNGNIKYNITQGVPIYDSEERLIAGLIVFPDITGQKEAEIKLKENEENLKITLQSIGDAVIAVDLKGKVRRMNPVAENLTGWKTEEAVGRDLIEVFVIKNALTEETAENPVERVLESGTIVGLANHTKLISKDGQEYQIADSASPIRNDQDELNGVVLIFRDVTEEYRIKRQLEEREEKYRLLTDNSADLIWTCSTRQENFVMRYINPAVEKMLGYTVEEFLELPIQQRMTAESLKTVDEVVCMVEQDRQTHSFEIQHIHKDGSLIDCELWVRPLLDDQNELIGFQGRTIDISRRKIQLQKQAEREEYLSGILKTTRDGFLVIDSSGIIRDFNQSYLNMLGFSGEELLQKQISDIDVGMGREKIQDKIELLTRKKSDLFQTRHRRKDGKDLDVEISTSFLNMNDGMFVSFVRDITERKKYEKALNESEERLRLLINMTPDIICFKDGEGRWMEANQADLELFSLTGVNYRGKTDSELADFTAKIYRESFLNCEESDEKAWRAGGISRGIEEIPVADGTVKVFDVIKVPAFEDYGKIRKGLVVFGRDITEQKKAEKALNESERRFRRIFEDSSLPQLILSNEKFVQFNQAALDLLKMEEQDLKNKSPVDISPEYQPDGLSSFEKSREMINLAYQKGEIRFEWVKNDSVGKPVWMEVLLTRISLHGENVLHVAWIDMNQRILAEKSLKEAYEQNQILLRELQHRVKNSFMMLLSLVSLSLRQTESGEANTVLSEIKNRIHSISELYDLLYITESIDRVDLEKYLLKLTDSYQNMSDKIMIEHDFEKVNMTVKQALSAGLIVSELIVNAFKYAFQKKKEGTVKVSMKLIPENCVEICVEDDGDGLPENFDLETAGEKSLGLRLIRTLAKQLNGSVSMENRDGTSAVLRFQVE